jgi:Lrp/AsnC family transcriptional regulator, leucine-responsive regulatory protein
MDNMDQRILALLQADAALSHGEIADRVHLSSSQVSRRIVRMTQEGIIRRQVVLLDEEQLGLSMEAFVAVSLSSYKPELVSAFHARISALDEVLDCCATTGQADYLLRIVARDLRSFSNLLNNELLGHGDVANVQSNVVLDRIKRTTALPLPKAK